MTIKRLVCSGGGAKGVIYAGAYEALASTGAITNIEEVSGTSAGAISAALIAFGMPEDKLRDALLSTNLNSLKGKVSDRAFYTRDGQPLLDEIRKQISNTILDFLKDKNIPELQEIENKVNSSPPGAITFSDLKKLREYDKNRFKALTVTAVNFETGDLQIFNADDTPNLEIALACRASASIPIVLQPVKIMFGNDEKTFIDGGILDNIPADYFDKNGDKFSNDKKNETLILAFGEGLDDNKNPILQALKTSNLIPDAFLEQLIEEANKAIGMHQSESLRSKIKRQLIFYTESNNITHDEADFIREAVNQLSPNLKINNATSIINISVAIKKKLEPKLYNAGFFNRLIRDTFVKWFAGFDKYKNTEQKEISFQNIRKNYIKQTIQLRVADIGTKDFIKAKKSARELIAMGYLDTMEYQFKNLMTEFDPDIFYKSILDKFKRVNKAILSGTNQNIEKDELLKKITEYENQGRSNRDIVWEIIKRGAEKNFGSRTAFALSRAVEWLQNKINEENLLIETHAKARPIISITNFNKDDKETVSELIKRFKNDVQNNSKKTRSEKVAASLFEDNTQKLTI